MYRLVTQLDSFFLSLLTVAFSTVCDREFQTWITCCGKRPSLWAVCSAWSVSVCLFLPICQITASYSSQPLPLYFMSLDHIFSASSPAGGRASATLISLSISLLHFLDQHLCPSLYLPWFCCVVLVVQWCLPLVTTIWGYQGFIQELNYSYSFLFPYSYSFLFPSVSMKFFVFFQMAIS